MFKRSVICLLAVSLMGLSTAPSTRRPLDSPPISRSVTPDTSVWTVNVAKVKPGMLSHARRYYEAGWLPARREALARGHVKSFRILAADRESPTQPEFVLITEFADQAAFDAREARFDAIFAALDRSGPIVIDGKTRADIFESLQGLENYRDVTSAPPS